MWQCMETAKNGRKGCPNSKAVPNDVLESAFVTTYNLLCGDLKTSFKAVYDEIEKEFDLDKISKDIAKKEADLEKLKTKKAKLIDLKLAESLDDATYKESYDDVCLKIEKTKNDIILLNEENTKIKDKKLNLENAKTILENGGQLEHFDKFVFESICDKIIVGDIEDPFKIQIILKTKDVFKFNAADYMLKLGDPTRYEKMMPVDTALLMKEAKEIEGNACGDYCVVRAKDGSKLIKILEFNKDSRRFRLYKDKKGCIEKRLEEAIPVEVFCYLG